jgi:hypothetical protein
MQLRGDQPTTGDYVTVHGEWFKLGECTGRSRISVRWAAVNKSGGRRQVALYTNQGYTCWTARACPECTYLDSHAEHCPNS